MPLAANSKLGPYDVRSLGAGGMGEVYRARDSRLNRDVAIKILRTDNASSADLCTRFEREARAVAAFGNAKIQVTESKNVINRELWVASQFPYGDDVSAYTRCKAA